MIPVWIRIAPVMSHSELLTKLYYSLSSPSSFASIKSLYENAKKENPNVSLEEVKQWLSEQLTYTLHRPVVRKFKTRPVVVYNMDEQWQADLVDLSKLSRYNKGYKYLLVVIDVLSKFLWVEPLHDKSGKELKRAFHAIFERGGRTPKKLQTDKGTEFLNSIVQNFLREKNIIFFTTNSERKSSIVERVNRTLKDLMFKYFEKHNTRVYHDVLQQLVSRYNNAYHRSIKMKPNEVTKENEPRVWITLYEGKLLPKKQPAKENAFKKGDTVRISIERGPFRKGYLERWSEEIFIIQSKIDGNPIVYKLVDQAGEDIKGTFYARELQKVIEPKAYRIEKVLRKKRDSSGRLIYLVKWKGYPDKFNSFVFAEDFET